MAKRVEKLTVIYKETLNKSYFLLRLKSLNELPIITPGQFVQIKIEGASHTFLRRPISIHWVDYENRSIDILVRIAGEGTSTLSHLPLGASLDVMYPLGNGFDWELISATQRPLLVGGGVGVAPLLWLGERMKQQGVSPIFLLGARSANDLLQFDRFAAIGDLYLTTEDGTLGQRGYVTDHSILIDSDFSAIYCCGPTPMMKSIALYARSRQIPCQVSLENLMACGFGVCLCCVEDTTQGHQCVCKQGPVFNIDQLLW